MSWLTWCVRYRTMAPLHLRLLSGSPNKLLLPTEYDPGTGKPIFDQLTALGVTRDQNLGRPTPLFSRFPYAGITTSFVWSLWSLVSDNSPKKHIPIRHWSWTVVLGHFPHSHDGEQIFKKSLGLG